MEIFNNIHMYGYFGLNTSAIMSILVIAFGLLSIACGYCRHLVSYFILGGAIILIFNPSFNNRVDLGFNVIFSETNLDTAKYLLKSIIQCQASIFALVISFSLVALQLVSSHYSARTVDLFRKSPEFWILILIYIISIILELGILKIIDSAQSELLNMENYIISSYQLGIFAILSIIPYIWFVLDELKPEALILNLSNKININNINRSKEVGDKDDPFVPIIDIISRSLSRDEVSTVLEGIDIIKARVISIMKTRNLDGQEQKRLSELFFKHIIRISILISNKSESYSANKVIIILEEIGNAAISEDFEQITLKTVEAQEDIGLLFAKMKMRTEIFKMALSIGRIGISAAEKPHNCASSRAAVALGEIGFKAAEQRLSGTIHQTAVILGKLGIIAVKLKDDELTIKEVANSLNKIGRISLKRGLKIDQIILELKEIEKAALKDKLDSYDKIKLIRKYLQESPNAD